MSANDYELSGRKRKREENEERQEDEEEKEVEEELKRNKKRKEEIKEIGKILGEQARKKGEVFQSLFCKGSTQTREADFLSRSVHHGLL